MNFILSLHNLCIGFWQDQGSPLYFSLLPGAACLSELSSLCHHCAEQSSLFAGGGIDLGDDAVLLREKEEWGGN
ncbi:MAG: hypothetical protein ACU4EQ_13415 [Candidatus Nitrosoglobus sp.]